MCTCMDLLNWVEPDMMAKILTCLDDPADLVRVCAVSRSWRHFVIENGLAKRLCLRMFPQLSRITIVVELNQNVSEDGLEVGSSSTSMEWESMSREHRVYASLAKRCSLVDTGNCIFKAVRASSTDNFPEERIANTLEPREVVGQRASYWSSEGQRRDNISETLLYKLVSDLCFITEINIQPFQAFFQVGFPIYSAKAVRFRMGRPEAPVDSEDDSMDESCGDEKFIWTYTSQIFQMDQLNCLQKFKFAEPVLAIGGYLQIELLGGVQRQETDGLYYICVANVQAVGDSLAPAFDAEIVDDSGTIILKRDLKEDILSSNIRKNKSFSSTVGNLERRVRTLEQIVEILRGNEFVYGWPGNGDDESDEEFHI